MGSDKIISSYKYLFNYFKNSKVDIPVNTNILLDKKVFYDDARGYKIAHIESINPIKFKGIFKGSYGIISQATCFREHKAPDLDCTCGFHSFKNIEGAVREVSKKWSAVLLKIENYGRIIEHTSGYRSQEQEIVEIIFQKNCAKVFCSRESFKICKFLGLYLPLCKKHSEKSGESYSLLELSNLTGIEFSFLKII